MALQNGFYCAVVSESLRILFEGWLYDWTSYYSASIHFGGASILVSSLMIIPAWLSTQCAKQIQKTQDIHVPLDVRVDQLPEDEKEANTLL